VKQSRLSLEECFQSLCALAVTIALSLPSAAGAQARPWIELGANAVPVYTWADPVPRGGSLGEIRLVQPAVMLHAGALEDRLRLLTTLNLEGLTMENGELAPGDWGEGFMDRRHPHTYLHEAVLSFTHPLGRSARLGSVSVAAGKGFAPFGTDDPMSRPIFRYPVNHHLAQILERAVVILGLQVGPALLEGGLFNGDEPERPGQWPRVGRFADSWSSRLTLFPAENLELQGSHAQVHSPEHRPGFGLDQSKWNISGRWAGSLRHSPVYALVEWSRTSEADGFFEFHSFLTEGAWRLGQSRLHYRFERTERPEEERTLNLFRSPRPILDNAILGKSRWTIYTLGYGLFIRTGKWIATFPFVETSYGRVAEVSGGLFDPELFYGKTSFWSLSIGARLNFGVPLHRMGRYGVAQNTANWMGKGHHGHHDDE
jgi:hypothetical protein